MKKIIYTVAAATVMTTVSFLVPEIVIAMSSQSDTGQAPVSCQIGAAGSSAYVRTPGQYGSACLYRSVNK